MVCLSSLAAGYTIPWCHECLMAESSSQDEERLASWSGGTWELFSQQERRFATLFSNISASNNPAIWFFATRTALSAVGVLGRKWVYLANNYRYGRLSKGLLVPPWLGTVSDEAPTVQYIRELVRARDRLAPIDIFEPEDIALVLEFITTY